MRFLECSFGHGVAYENCGAFPMSDLVRDAHQEFWRPPLAQTSVANADSCRRCGTEFMVGAAFCHICGMNRHRATSAPSDPWTKYLSGLHGLDFSRIQNWLALPFAPLCAFLLGTLFLALALAVGLMSAEFEAIQLWRIQWLLAACAAFLAGILLKDRKRES